VYLLHDKYRAVVIEVAFPVVEREAVGNAHVIQAGHGLRVEVKVTFVTVHPHAVLEERRPVAGTHAIFNREMS